MVTKRKGDTSHGLLAEKKLAKRLGGKQQIGSGALEHAKGDVELELFLVESKSSVNNSIAVRHEWLAKIAQEALNKNKQPALALTFCSGNGTPVKGGSWVMIRECDFKDYQAYLSE